MCTDCSDRSHPSHIGFVAGNRIHVHLCCYYRAIGVFVYWLTKSTDIESDNRHYSQPPESLPRPFHTENLPLVVFLFRLHTSSPFWSRYGLWLCLSPPTHPTDPPNIAAGRVKRVRERNHRSVHRVHKRILAYVSTWPASYVCTLWSCARTQRRERAYTIEFRTPGYRSFAPVQTVKMPVHTPEDPVCCLTVEIVHRRPARFSNLISATRSDRIAWNFIRGTDTGTWL